MNVTLVGGAGFIGHSLAIKLRSEGHEVQVIDNLMWNNLSDNVMADIDGFKRELYHGFLMQRFDLIRLNEIRCDNVDARNPVDLTNALSVFKPDCIVHLSAISSALRARENPGLCFDLQLITLRNVLEYARQDNTKVVLMSSSTVYGDFDGNEVTEDTRPKPKGIYANAKYMAERLCRTYSDQYGIATTIIRPSALYGERCISGRVSQAFIEQALTKKPLRLDAGGRGRLDFTYIDDLVAGICKAIKHSSGSTNTFNITFGQSRSILELAEIVNEVIPCAFKITPANDMAPVRGTLSNKRARDVLGFKAVWPLETGFKRYCEWYKDQWDVVHSRRSSVNLGKRRAAPHKKVQT